MVDLVERGGRISGVIMRMEGREIFIEARCGVILASGGFAHNLEMRREYHPHPITVDWTVASPTDLGDRIRAGVKVGAATAADTRPSHTTQANYTDRDRTHFSWVCMRVGAASSSALDLSLTQEDTHRSRRRGLSRSTR